MELYKQAKQFLGKDISKTQNELGCAESVNYVWEELTGEPVGGGLSTIQMKKALKKSKRFYVVYTPEPGDIVLSETEGKNTGHVGMMSDKNRIMSNNSMTSKWSEHLSLDTWRYRYVKMKGLKMEYFRYIGFQEDLKLSKKEIKELKSVVNSFILFIKNKLNNIIKKHE